MPPPHTELPEEEDVENPDDDVGDGDDDDGMDDDFTESPTSSTPAPTLSTPAPTPSTPAPTPSTPAPSMSDIVDDDILLSEIPTVSPSVNEEEVSPTEIEEEQSRSRSLFPFSLEISGQMGIEDVDEGRSTEKCLYLNVSLSVYDVFPTREDMVGALAIVQTDFLTFFFSISLYLSRILLFHSYGKLSLKSINSRL